MANPEFIAQYLQRVKASDNLEIIINQGGVITRCPVRWSELNGAIEITLS